MDLLSDPIKNLGQYFTPKFLAEFMVQLLDKKDPIRILEPSAGTGIFLEALEKFYTNIVAIEIDDTLPSQATTPIQHQNFFDYPVHEKFDVIIGNPPYVRWRNQPQEIRSDIIQRKFWNNRINALADILQAFIFKSIDHLKDGGELLFLTPKFWLQTLHAANLRKFILEQGYIDLIIDFNEKKIFSSVSSNLIIFKFIKAPKPSDQHIKVFTFLEKESVTPDELALVLETYRKHTTDKVNFSNAGINFHLAKHPIYHHSWNLFSDEENDSISEIETSCRTHYTIEISLKSQNGTKINHVPLVQCLSLSQVKKFALEKSELPVCYIGDTKRFLLNTMESDQRSIQLRRYVSFADIYQIGNGMVSGLDKVFQLSEEKNKSLLIALTDTEQTFIQKVVKARNMNQYKVKKYALYIFIEENTFSTEEEFKQRCPHLYNHLEPHKEDLLKRWSPKPVPWYVWSFPRNQIIFQTFEHKFYLPCKERFDNKGFIRCVYEQDQILGVQDITVLGLYPWIKESPEYLLAYLNSDVLFQWLQIKGLKRGGVFQFSEHPLSMIPVRLIDWKDPQEVLIHKTIHELTRKILTSHSEEDIQNHKQIIEEQFRTLIINQRNAPQGQV